MALKRRLTLEKWMPLDSIQQANQVSNLFEHIGPETWVPTHGRSSSRWKFSKVLHQSHP